MNNNAGFVLNNATNLVLNNINLTGASSDPITVTNTNADVHINNSVINGNISSAVTYDLGISGNSIINGTVGTANASMSSGSLVFNTDTFANANAVSLTGGTVNLEDNNYNTYIINNLTSAAAANYDIDFDATNKQADIIAATGTSTGTVTLNHLNIAGDFSGVTADYSVQIIQNNATSSLQLALSDAVITQLGGTTPTKYFETTDTVTGADAVTANTSWTDNFYNWHRDDTINHFGTIGLTTTSTTNDSIGYIESSTTRTTGDRENDSLIGDALKLVNNDTTNETKNFTAPADGSTYTVTENLGATKGTVNINGVEGGSTDTINLNNKTGFELGDANSVLNFNNVTVGGNTTIANVTNTSAIIGLNNTILNGDIAGSGYAVNTSGNTTLNGTVGGNVTNSGTLNSTIDNLLGTITNNGMFNMSGDLSKDIAGTGSTVLQSVTSAVAADRSIDGTLNLNGKSVTMSDTSFETLSLGNLTGNGNLTLDVNAQTDSADIINISDGSDNNSTVTITSLNLTKPVVAENEDSKEYSKQIVTGNSAGVTLTLSDAVTTMYNVTNPINRTGTDDLDSNAIAWNDSYGGWTQSGTQTEAVSIIASSGTLLDTLKYELNKSWGAKTYTSNAENLALINQYTGTGSDNRSMNFAGIFDSPNAGTYTMQASTSLGTTSAGTLTLNGEVSGSNITTVDLNNNAGFVLNNATDLVLINTNLTGASGDLITATNDDASVTLNNSVTDGNIVKTGTNKMDVTTTGNTTLGGNSTNVNVINNGTLTNNGTITGTITNNSVMTTTADNISGATITNNNTLNLSGNLAQAVTGAGTTNVNSALTLNSGAGVAGTLDMNNGTVTVSSGDTTNHNIGTISGTGNVKLDYNTTTGNIDTLTIGTPDATGATINVTQLDIGTTAIADLADFEKQVLIGADANTRLDVSSIADDFRKTSTVDQTDTTTLTNPTINWNDKYGVEKWSDIYTSELSVTSSTPGAGLADTIKYATTKTGETAHVFDPEYDNLALINKYSGAGSDDRNFNFGTENDRFTVTENLGTTHTGDLTINGVTNGENSSVIDFNGHSGFELNESNTTLTLKNVEVTGASKLINSTQPDSVVNIDNTKLDGTNGGITTSGTINVTGNSYIGDNITLSNSNSSINVDGSTGTPTLDSRMIGLNGTQLNLSNGEINLGANAKIMNIDTTLTNTTLNMANEKSLAGVNTTFNGTNTLNMANNNIGTLAFGDMNINGLIRMSIDADLANKAIDKLTANNVIVGPGGRLEVQKINLLSPTTEPELSLLFTNNSTLAGIVSYTGENEIVYSPIYKYITTYENKDGNGYFKFVTPSHSGGGSSGGNAYNDFNPAIMASPAAAQGIAQVSMHQIFETSFEHADGFMPLPAAERMSVLRGNTYAINDVTNPAQGGVSTDFNDNLDLSSYSETSYENKAVWVKPYTSFERINLHNGPKVDMISYGTLFGGDSDFRKLKNGWSNVGTLYLGYTGASMDYSGVDTTLNGGVLGITESFYKKNFFTAITASVGASFAEANTMYGKDDMTMLMAGVASKTGYNFEFKEGKYIIQPSLLMSYSMVNTFDYTNKAGVKIDSDPLHTIQINPNVRFIANLPHGWQPYASVGMVYNVMNDSNVMASTVKLPESHVKPYVEYGIGVQKHFGETFSGYGQAMVRNGGRNGISLTAGFRWALSDKKVKDNKNVKEDVKTIKKVNFKTNKELSQTHTQLNTTASMSDNIHENNSGIINDVIKQNINQSVNKNVNTKTEITQTEKVYDKSAPIEIEIIEPKTKLANSKKIGEAKKMRSQIKKSSEKTVIKSIKHDEKEKNLAKYNELLGM